MSRLILYIEQNSLYFESSYLYLQRNETNSDLTSNL